MAALEAEVKADADAARSRKEAALAKLRAQQAENQALRERQAVLVARKDGKDGKDGKDDADSKAARSSKISRSDLSDQELGLSGALELAGRANRVKQELVKRPTKGEKSWIKSGLASLVLGPFGWLYAGSLREAVPASLGWLAFATLASKLIPMFLLMPVLMVVLPLSAIAGVVYAMQYNRHGSRQRRCSMTRTSGNSCLHDVRTKVGHAGGLAPPLPLDLSTSMGRLAPILAVVLVCVARAASADPPKLRVAVVPGIAVNLDAARVDALSQDLAEALDSELEVEAVGGLEVRRLLPADGLPPDCVTTPACVAKVAKATGASQLLFVVMVDSGAGGSIQIDTTWIETSSGHNASRPAIDLTSTADAEAKAKFQTVASTLLPDAAVRKKATAGQGGTTIIQTNPTVTEGTPRHLTMQSMITGGVAIVGLGAGLGFGLGARSKYNRCDASFQTCTSGDRSSISTFDHVADASWIIGAGAAIATIVLFATSGEAPHLVVTPTPDGGAAITAFGSF